MGKEEPGNPKTEVREALRGHKTTQKQANTIKKNGETFNGGGRGARDPPRGHGGTLDKRGGPQIKGGGDPE